MQGASAKPALLGPMSSDWGDTWTHTLVAEPYSSVQVRTGALQVVLYSRNRVMCSLASCRTARSNVGRETHAHCYWLRTTCIGHEVGCLSMPLRLSASLPTVEWPNGFGRVWRGAGARQLQHIDRERPPRLQSTCSCPSTPPLRLIRSKVTVGDL